MTFASPTGPRTGTTARIRILGDPQPISQGPPRGPLLIVSAVVAIAGVGLTLAFQTLRPQGGSGLSTAPASAAATGVSSKAEGPARAAVVGRPHVQRVLLDASDAAIPAAARYAALTTAQASVPATSLPVQIPTAQQHAVPGSTYTRPAATAPREQPALAPDPVQHVGPEAPPNPANPNSLMGSP